MRLATAILVLSLALAPAAPVRAGSAGRLDPTFNGGIVKTYTTEEFGEIRGLAIQPDGKIVAAGRIGDTYDTPVFDDQQGTSVMTLTRYLPDGSLDATFGTGGRVVIDALGNLDQLTSVVVQPDGKIAAAGITGIATPSGRNASTAVVRVLADGAIDTGFATGGINMTGPFSHNRETLALVLRADGKLVTAGHDLIRYNSDGTLDTSFGVGGRINLFPILDPAYGLVLQPDGYMVVVGHKDSDLTVARLDPDGILDPTFGLGGVATVDLGDEEEGRAVALQPDGAVVVAGCGNSNCMDSLLVRFDATGTRDPSFGTLGIQFVDVDSTRFDQFVGIVVQPDGKVVAAGHVQSPTAGSALETFTLARVLADGTLDASFGNGGLAGLDLRRGRDFLSALALQADGRLVLGGGDLGGVLVRHLGGTCGDGVPDGGEECDDGNLTNGDGCDASCCLADTDGDGRCDSLDPCTGGVAPIKAKVVANRLDNLPPTPNNIIGDNAFTLNAEFVIAHPFAPALDPVANGIRFLIEDAAGTPMEVLIPGGAFANPPRLGWTAKPTGSPTPTRWKYVDKRKHSPYGLVGAKVQDKSNQTPGLIKVTITGKRSFYTDLVANLPLTATAVAGTGAAQCAIATFAGPLPPTCAVVGSKLTCQ